jgi:hypothetical protein
MYILFFVLVQPSMLNRSSSSPVRTGPLNGLNGPPDCHGFPPLGVRVVVVGGGTAGGALGLVEDVMDSADGCVGREAAAEYESLENILSNPPPFPPAAVPGVLKSGVGGVAFGPRLNHSIPPVPGLPLPTLLRLGLGPIFGGGGKAWIRE